MLNVIQRLRSYANSPVARGASTPLHPVSPSTGPENAPPDASKLTEPPCLIMLGGLGDVLIALCIAKHYADRFGKRTPFLTSAKFQNLLAGCSYVEGVGYSGGSPWHGYHEAIKWAKQRFHAVYPLHVGDADVQAHLATTRFCHEQYLYAGVPGCYGEFPLVIDRRDVEREQHIVARVKGRDSRPLFLYTLEGRSSPFAQADALLGYLTARWGKQLHFVNTSSLSLSHYQDMLGLLDASVGAITIDTSTIHLMPASETPYIALLNDTKTPWWQSVPRGNVALELGYTRVMGELPSMNVCIASMLRKKGIEPKPEVAAVPEISRQDKPHLVTLACGGMESVWNVAYRTWKPWCAARGISFEAHTKAPIPSMHPSWNKLRLVLDALEHHEVVWWVDSDITVARTNATLPDSKFDLVFSTDWNGLCAAMFRARATEWTKNFLRAALFLGDVRDHDAFGKGCGVKWEQNTMKLLLQEFPSCYSHVSFLPSGTVADRDWRHGSASNASFNHFGGIKNNARIAAMRKVHGL